MDRRFTQVEFGPHTVDVPEGGYYDRFRMNPDLDAVARDPAAGNIDFFRRIPKRQVASRVGPTWAPNGRVLMFTRESPGAAGGAKMFTVDITGRNLKAVAGVGGASDPTWGPLLP